MTKLLIAALLSLALLAPAGARADDARKTHFLTLQGHGEVKAKPDMAMIEMGTLSQALTAKAALDANTAKVTALIAMLASSAAFAVRACESVPISIMAISGLAFTSPCPCKVRK